MRFLLYYELWFIDIFSCKKNSLKTVVCLKCRKTLIISSFFYSKSERKFMFLQRQLEHIQERELTAQETLSQVLTVVSVV